MSRLSIPLLLLLGLLNPVQSQTSGPYVQPGTANKVVTIPEPPTPNLSSTRTDCPHQATDGLLDWHDPSTWGGSIPAEGADVTLPDNAKVVITQTVTEKLGYVTIPSTSELILGEDASGIQLNAHGFTVFGSLIAGSETCAIENPITITLHGNRPADASWNVPQPHIKGLNIAGGTLSLHGKRYFKTWVRLAATVEPGDTAIVLQHAVNWEPNQRVVLVTSAMLDHRAYNRNEVLIVASVEANPPPGAGALVHLTTAAQYQHLATSEYQVEVGLLSRTVVVQGAEADSETTDPDPLDCISPDTRQWTLYYGLSTPCMDKELTGYGGHIMVHSNGRAMVEGVELYRMGQTNVKARYPMHFHILGDCPSCYFKHSSVHRSFYRCISIHGTHNTTVTENVAYDVIGYCYYLEDGVEEFNTLSYNLGALIHTIGPDIPSGNAQTISEYDESANLRLPADVTASAFYITNAHNYIDGNAASGGWAGFAFPSLPEPTGFHRTTTFRPSNRVQLSLDGNTAHSTGFWWSHAPGFYFGGTLYYPDNSGNQRYNAGRSQNFRRDSRAHCAVNSCAEPNHDCAWGCPEEHKVSLFITNSKTFLIAGVGLNSWTGAMDVIGFESYDSALAIESLSNGFWIDQMHVECRTGVSLGLPTNADATKIEGSGFYWYDTGQSHIITNSHFKNCGYRSDELTAFDTSPTRGCGDDASMGCRSSSTVFGFLTHSDQFTPEIMQGTKDISYEECGRRFRYTVTDKTTVSGRGQNWLDTDGTASGLGEPTLIGSGFDDVRSWWGVDDEVTYTGINEGPISFIKKDNGPERDIGHVRFEWDESLSSLVGETFCSNGGNPPKPCEPLGYVRHLGEKFSPNMNPSAQKGLPITANPDTVGPIGGFGWVLALNDGAPRKLKIDQIEVSPSSMLLLSIAYPPGTSVQVTAKQQWCWQNNDFSCEEVFTGVNSVEEVRNSTGNAYHMDSFGVLTFRVFQLARQFTGNPNFFFPTYETPARDGINNALPRFSRGGVTLPEASAGTYLLVEADCAGSGIFCAGGATAVVDYDPVVCPEMYEQVAYDKCCSESDPTLCIFANGADVSRRFDTNLPPQVRSNGCGCFMGRLWESL